MDINKKVCNYITREWVLPSKSKRSFALDHNIDEKTVRKIFQEDGYNIPLITLHRICEAKEISLEEFFKRVSI